MSSSQTKCACNKRTGFPATVRATVNNFERIISFRPGYRCTIDARGPNGGRSHGQHGVDLIFVLKGAKGAVQFLVYTMWTPGSGDVGQRNTSPPFAVFPVDLGYHSPVPRYEDQQVRNNCEWLEGKPCYYDGSSLNAVSLFNRLTTEGETAVWEEMELYYHDLFDEARCP